MDPSPARVGVRPATAYDLPRLQAIEAAAGHRFDAVMDTSGWGAPPTGEQRAELPGLLLVAGEPPFGFAHVLLLGEVGGPQHAHLEEVGVLPGAGRRGVGTALVQAACRAAADLGHAELTLRTFADVPWNGPWYARLGFTVLDAEPPWLVPLREREERAGLTVMGARIAMTRPLTALGAPGGCA